MVGIYEAIDTGPSGHGQVSRGHLEAILEEDEFDITARTHQWGWNEDGPDIIQGINFTDTRFKHNVMSSDRYNEEYSVSSQREKAMRPDDLTQHLARPDTVRPHDCIINEVESDSDMDIWHTVGGMDFGVLAPDEPYTIVETDYNLDIVPEQWVEIAKEVDEVWVPNQWNYDAWNRRGYTDNIKIMPYGVDFKYKPTAYDCSSCRANKHTNPPGGGTCIDDDTFTFLSVARWYHIKGVDSLIKGYIENFSSSDDVRLILKTTMNAHADLTASDVGRIIEQVAEQMGVNDIPEIGVRTDPLSDQKFMDLLGVCDAFVLPSRAECVGIAWIQAMHAGTQVITTNWSAMDTYLDSDKALLVDGYDLERHKQQVEWLTYNRSSEYPPDGNWANVSPDAVAEKMREAVVMEEEDRKEMEENAKEFVHDMFDWNKRGKERIQRMKEVS
jgi:glycosyltransferase involved in cell wall biosynthesis